MRRYYPPEARSDDEAISIAFKKCDDTISGQYPHHSRHEELIIWEQVGWALSMWGQVEIGLANIFQTVSGGKKSLPAAIEFWQIHNVAVRIKKARKAIELWSAFQEESVETLTNEIVNWLAKITMALNCARNELAHGTVIQQNSSNDYHLVPFLFKQMIERDRANFIMETKHGRNLDDIIMLRKQFLGFSGLLADLKVNLQEIDAGRNEGNSDLEMLRYNLPLFVSQHPDLFDRLKVRPFNQGDSLSKKEIDEIEFLLVNG